MAGRYLAGAALAAAAATAAISVAAAAPGADVDVSRALGVQAETAVAADPSNPNVLLAASNSLRPVNGGLQLTYTSTDGGVTWTDSPAPTPSRLPTNRRRCALGDPVPAIGPDGAEYLSFLTVDCRDLRGGSIRLDDVAIAVDVASRLGPSGPWHVAAVAPSKGPAFDDKPSIGVAPSGRVYEVWTRSSAPEDDIGGLRMRIVVSHSDDHGATWSAPVAVSSPKRGASFGQVAADAAGNVYVAWFDISGRILVAKGDGTRFGAARVVDAAAGKPLAGGCGDVITRGLPAQPKRCVTPTPTLALDDRPGIPERVYVTYAVPGPDGVHEQVALAAFDAQLNPLLGTPAGAVDVVAPSAGSRLDRFFPASAVGPDGSVWVCFYDTGPDTTRRSATYSCTASTDGGVTWTTPLAVASVPSNETQKKSSPFEFGDYEGLAVGSDGVAHPIWTDSRDLATRGEEIYTSRLTLADLAPTG